MMCQMDCYIWGMSSKFICISPSKFSVYFSIITCFFLNELLRLSFGLIRFFYFYLYFIFKWVFYWVLFWIDFVLGWFWVWFRMSLSWYWFDFHWFWVRLYLEYDDAVLGSGRWMLINFRWSSFFFFFLFSYDIEVSHGEREGEKKLKIIK